MSKRPPQSENVDSDSLPPIPDGGLSTGMPDWLRRPPAWRALDESAAAAKVVPKPDTSPIDPRTILTVDDLPEWLQRIAASRPEDPPVTVAPRRDDDALVPQEPEPEAAIPVAVPETGPGSSRQSVAASSPVGVRTTVDDPIPLSVTPSTRPRRHKWWKSGALVVPLIVCLVIALSIIALYATNVV